MWCIPKVDADFVARMGIPDLATLRRETRTGNEQRNASGARIRWLFDLERARQKLGKSYPQPAPAAPLPLAD
jgi:hypothetical protein